MIRVVIADDHPQIRVALRHALEDDGDFEVVGEARNGADAVEVAGRTQPDIVVLDYRMPHLNGVDAAREIGRRHPGVALIMLSGDDDEDVVTRAEEAGVSSYVSKSEQPEKLLIALRRAAGGSRDTRRPA